MKSPVAATRRRRRCWRGVAGSLSRVWLGLVRNLSLQGMYIDSALRHVTHEVAPGDLPTVAFVLPSGRPCKLRAMVVHCDRHGCGVQFRQGPLPSLAHLAHYCADLDSEEDLDIGPCSGRW